MSLFSPLFIGFSVLFVLLFRLYSGYAWRASVMLAANILFVSGFFTSLAGAMPLIGFLLLGYLAILSVQALPHRALSWTWVVVFVGLFAWLQGYSLISFVPSLPTAISTIGLSYVLFRILHMIFDAREETLPDRVNFVDYLNYTTNFLAFVSGPIDRFQTFKANFMTPLPADTLSVRAALGRVTVGYGKVLILSASALYIFDNIAPQLLGPEGVAGSKLIVFYCIAAASYTFYLYMNFGGYMDIVIGIGRLAGLALPENFNKPFASRGMIEFWSRWHMTLSNWFKQYAFIPILQTLMMRWPSAGAAPIIGIFTYFVVFMVLGIWHGSTPIFVVYGFALGLGVSLNKMWQVLLTAQLGHKRFRELSANRLYTYAARGLTIGYFTIALTAFWFDLNEVGALTERIHLTGWVLALGLLSVGWAIIAVGLDLLTKRVPWPLTWHTAPAGLAFGTMAGILYTCLTAQTILNKGAGFVYAAF
ncbi:MBOAT family O-acyltransferase [Falsihalocynthiibacter sp. S25ZX9]|uniref:MBOAT family O-acyltransferase n=1 Tax=Falsihalocynthiibacter sp. S25ZX9 TaxID=3240870 RepID=UPI00350FD4FC